MSALSPEPSDFCAFARGEARKGKETAINIHEDKALPPAKGQLALFIAHARIDKGPTSKACLITFVSGDL